MTWGRTRVDAPSYVRVEDDRVIVTEYSTPAPDRFVRDITVLVRAADGTWRRDDERHDNVLVEVDRIPGLLADAGVDAEVRDAFGAETLPVGLGVLVGARRALGS